MKHFLLKTKTKLFLLCAGVLLLLALCAAVILGRHTRGSAVTLSELELSFGKGGSAGVISLWRQNQAEDGADVGAEPGDGWFFLPAYADLADLRLLYNDTLCTLLLNEQPLGSGVRLHDIANGSMVSLTFVGPEGEVESTPLHFVQSANLASLFVQTQSGSMADIRADKAYREAAEMKLVQANGKVNYNGALEYIKGRGNQTWTLDKRGYGFRLAQKTGLLGMESAKNWVLLANAFDDSMLRNTFAYNMADALGLAYTPQSRFCDLYLNGVYAGTYQLTEKVEVGDNRVEITDLDEANRQANGGQQPGAQISDTQSNTSCVEAENDPADLTGGYLLERDYGDKYADETAWFTTDKGEVFVLKSPSSGTKAEVAYIEGVMQSLENAIYAPDGIDPDSGLAYTEILDLESWVRLFLIDEFTKNEGGGASSAWYYKDTDAKDGRVYSGPIWDYDKSLGRYARWAGTDGLMLMAYHDYSTPWFRQLYAQPEFYDALVADYRDLLLPYLQQVLDEDLDSWAENISASWNMDKIRWSSYYGWINYYNDTSTLKSCTDYLRGWTQKRIDFLNSVWLDGQEYYTVKLDNSMRSTPYYYLYAKAGQPLESLPEGRGGEGTFLHWVIEGTDIIVDETTPITQDLRLAAVWSGAEPEPAPE